MGAHDFLTALFDGAAGAVRLCALRNRKSKLPRGEIARAYGIGAAEGFIAGRNLSAAYISVPRR